MEQLVRNAVYDGKFYPETKPALNQLIQKIYDEEIASINLNLTSAHIIGGIVPHAGYVYSASEAIHFYTILKKSLQKFDTIVVINPNHTGYGTGLFNTSTYKEWKTPFGNIESDMDFKEALGIEPNNKAHALEHSGEVQLPLLQYFYHYPFKVVMITMNQQTVNSSKELALHLYNAVKETGRKILIIASTDFSHFENPKSGYIQDQYMVDQILKLNTKGIYDEVKKHQISSCGYGTIMTLIEYAKKVSRKPGISLLKRGHSGDIFPSEEVVDYISFLCYEK